MRGLSFRTSGFSLAFLFAAALASAVGCMSLSNKESDSGDWGSSGVGGGIILPGVGGAGGAIEGTGTGNPTPPYLMGSYAYLCGGDTATCVPGKSLCNTINPGKNDTGFGGSLSSSSAGGSSGVGGSSSTTGSSGVGGDSSTTGSSGVGGDSSTTGSSGVGGSSSTTGSSGVGGDSSTTGSSGTGGSSSTTGSGGAGGGSSSATGSSSTGSSGSSTGAGGDGGTPATLTCTLSPVNNAAQAICTAPGDLSVGDPCLTVADCGVGLACVATPSGGLCRPYCCGQVEDCPSDTYCAPTLMAEAPVKIPVCLPAHQCKVLDETTCPAGQTCTIVRDSGTTSCVDIGAGVRGDECPCAQGHVCSKFTNTCLKLCHIGNDAADCGAGSCQGGVMAYPDGIGICVGYP